MCQFDSLRCYARHFPELSTSCKQPRWPLPYLATFPANSCSFAANPETSERIPNIRTTFIARQLQNQQSGGWAS